MPLVVLAILFWTSAFYSLVPESKAPQPVAVAGKSSIAKAAEARPEPSNLVSAKTSSSSTGGTADDLTAYALSLLGSPYVYAGMSPNGFDCSGFITYVFDKHGVDLPHSSAMQAEEGFQVPKHEASTGDLVIFTGTNPDVREPGHVGIVLSSPGDTIEFVHSSSNGGVKISKVEGTRYDLRFLEVRRVL